MPGASDKTLQQERANMRLVGTPARRGQQVDDLELGCCQRLSIDDDRAQQQVDERDKAGGDRGIERVTSPSQDPDRG
jgi:hypothetical protein